MKMWKKITPNVVKSTTSKFFKILAQIELKGYLDFLYIFYALYR